MRRFLLAMRIFFRTLLNAEAAKSVEQVLSGAGLPPPVEEKPAALPKPRAPEKPTAPVRSDALTVLAALQRDARFVDFVKEPLGDYSDAQIGAAARDVMRDSAAVLDRMFAIQPLLPEGEGAEVEVPAGFDAGQFRLTGNVTGEPPFRGHLVHHGWEATKCELPAWTGSKSAANVIAAAEVELK
jgi:hypothetical protein